MTKTNERDGLADATAQWNELERKASRETDDDAEDGFNIGRRDGFSEAVQLIDTLTGGDGEYRFCTNHDPKRHCPDPVTMIGNILGRMSLTTAAVPAEPSERTGRGEASGAWWVSSEGVTVSEHMLARMIESAERVVEMRLTRTESGDPWEDDYTIEITEPRSFAQNVIPILRAFASLLPRLAATPSQPAEPSEGVERAISDIVRDVCELPGDDDPDGDDTLILTVDDLRLILEHHLLPNQPAESEDRHD
ncbi:MAG: hypothetical protein J7496_08765 [Novosphingobium sp.]|nr:hypothetical protein [Novosphingobium sp.]